MTPRLLAIALAGLLVGATAGHAQTPAHVAERVAWWQAPNIQQELRLTSRQVRRLEQVYQESLPERRRLRADAERCERELADALAAGDEGRSLTLIDEAARAQTAHGRERALLVWRMYRILTREQRAQLTKLAQLSRMDAHAVFDTSPGVSTPR